MAPTNCSRGRSPGLAPPVQRDPSRQKRERALGWLWAVQPIHNALEPPSTWLCYSPPKHWGMIPQPSPNLRLRRSLRRGRSIRPIRGTSRSQPTACLSLDARTQTTTWSRSSSRDKPQGGCRRDGRTSSTPGHYSKQKASPAGFCSTRAAVNETIYCTPISVQPLDPCTASPIVLSALIKAGSSRLLWPVQLGQPGSSSEEGDRESQLWSSVQNKERLLPRRLVPTAERRMETISVPSPVLHEHCQR